MHRKLITACLAVAALAAFMVPASASATNNPILTHPTGTALGVGKKIEGTNIGTTLLQTTGANPTTILECETATVTGEITSNTAGNVTGDITSATFTGTGAGGACTGIFTESVTPENLPWCLKSTAAMETDEFQVFGGACTGAATKVSFKLTGAVTCKYTSTTTTVAKGKFTTDGTNGESSDAILSIPRSAATANTDAGFTKVEGGILCPSTGQLKMSFTLETDGTNEQIWIS